MCKFKKGDVVEIVDFDGAYGVAPGRIEEHYYASSPIREVVDTQAPTALFPKGRVGLVGDTGVCFYFSASAVRLVQKKEWVALKDMSIEAFLEATSDRGEVFCRAITYLIENVVCEDDEQIYVDQLLDVVFDEGPFWKWLIAEGFIGEKPVLKPCPFCGSSVAPYLQEEAGQCQVVCNGNNGGCGGSSGWSDFNDSQVGRWNMRQGA